MLRAIFFDCDGVLADSEPLHWRAMDVVLRREGLGLTWDEYLRDYLGRTDPDMFRRALEAAGRACDDGRIESLVAAKADVFPDILDRELAPLPGVVELVRRVAARWPLAVCSGAFRADIETIVTRLGIADCFRAIVSNEDIVRGKPDPEGFLLALRRVNELRRDGPPIRPDECVVIEDSLPGVAAGKAAGMRVIRLVPSRTGSPVVPPRATSERRQSPQEDVRVSSLVEVTDELLLGS